MARRYVVLAIPESGLFYKDGRFRTGKGLAVCTERLDVFASQLDAEKRRDQQQRESVIHFDEPFSFVVAEVDLRKKGGK